MKKLKEVETCCVADQMCIASAEVENPKSAKGKCFRCGQAVCSKCSSKRNYLIYGKVRLCNDCQVECDGNDNLVMKRLRKLVGVN